MYGVMISAKIFRPCVSIRTWLIFVDQDLTVFLKVADKLEVCFGCEQAPSDMM